MINTNKLKQEQLNLAKKVSTKDDFGTINLIAGCDHAYYLDTLVCSVVVLNYQDLSLVESKHTVEKIKFPYIPTYLAYRESPATVETYHQLNHQPDLIIVDGNGILHPRRIGLASQLGLQLDTPTIGIAKKLLLGEQRENKIYVDHEPRAVVMKTKQHAKPIYISPGHRTSLASSVKMVNHCLQGHKLPQPLKLAHTHATKIRNQIKQPPKQETQK